MSWLVMIQIIREFFNTSKIDFSVWQRGTGVRKSQNLHYIIYEWPLMGNKLNMCTLLLLSVCNWHVMRVLPPPYLCKTFPVWCIFKSVDAFHLELIITDINANIKYFPLTVAPSIFCFVKILECALCIKQCKEL